MEERNLTQKNANTTWQTQEEKYVETLLEKYVLMRFGTMFGQSIDRFVQFFVE